MARNNTIDALRIVAAFGVVSLHGSPYPELPHLFGDFIFDMFRWGVPYFFAVTGYFLADEDGRFPVVTLERLTRPLVLFALASMLFAPLLFARAHVDGFDLSIFVRGTSLQLWYLTALVIALATLHVLGTYRLWRTALAIALAIIILNFLVNAYYVRSHNHYQLVMVARELIGIPCVLAGCVIRRLDWRARRYAVVLGLGCVLLIAEAIGTNLLGYRSLDDQWLPSTPLVAFGLLGLATTAPWQAPVWLGEWGRQDSLALYIYHPAIMVFVASAIARRPILTYDQIPGLPLWLLTAMVTLLLIRALCLLPKLRQFLDGDLTALSKPAD